ncbi:MAG: hypothetical protein JNL67_09800 [Planctomycetaceae bacterium]|nr:hypothetical protein [Planctomycetaceae bacterium]
MAKRCPKCGMKYAANFSFCNADGAALIIDHEARPQAVVQPPPIPTSEPQIGSGNRWVRRPGEFAARLESTDLKALLNKGIAVEEGTQGLLFQDGRMTGLLPPGHHTLETFTQRLKNFVFGTPVSVVLVDISQTTISIKTTLMHTSDDQTVDCEAQVVVAVQNPVDFYINVVKGRSLVLVDEIANNLAGWVQETIAPIVLRSRADELYGNPEIRERVELDLRQALQNRLARLGLVLVGVDHLRIDSHVDSEIRRQRGELNRKQALEELTQAYRAFEERLASNETQQKMRQLTSEADLAQFIKSMEHDVFRKDLLSQQDRENLVRQYNENKAKNQMASDHLLAQTELIHREELARLTHEFKIEDFRRDYEMKSTTLKNQGALSAEQRRQDQQRLDEELAGQQRREIAEFEQKLLNERRTFDWQLEAEAARERQKLTIDGQKQKQKFENAQAALGLYIQMKTEKQKLAQQDRQFEFGLQEQAAATAHEREMDKAAQFNELSPDALIALAPREQAALLADLQKTETLRGMSEAQILALFAKDSPEIARALAEKFKAAGSAAEESKAQAEKLYERMLADKDSMLQTFQGMHRDVMRATQELAQTAMNVQRDTATSAATPVIVQNAAAPQPYASTTASALTCQSCRHTSPIGSRFCHTCGNSF